MCGDNRDSRTMHAHMGPLMSNHDDLRICNRCAQGEGALMQPMYLDPESLQARS